MFIWRIQASDLVSRSPMSFWAAVLALTTIASASVAAPPENLQAGYYDPELLVAYGFEGTGSTEADLTETDQDMLLANGLDRTAGMSGHGQALNFDNSGFGANKHARLEGLETGGAMTFAIWVKFESFDSHSRVFDFDNADCNSANNRIVLWHPGTTSSARLNVMANGSGSPESSITVTNFWELDTWVHVIATIDESGTTRLYKNGVLAGELFGGEVPNRLVRNRNYIGRSGRCDAYFNGVMDDFVIIERALSPAEAADFYGAVKNSGIEIRSIPEDAPNGTLVASANAEDPDSDPLTYHLLDDAGGRFAIDTNTGAITVADSTLIDHEEGGSYQITIEAKDPGGQVVSRSFAIDIRDVDDGAPNNIRSAFYHPAIAAAYDFESVNGTFISDVSTQNHDATLVGGATISAGRPGHGSALTLSSSKYAEIAGLESGGAMTVSAWVMHTSCNSGCRIFDFGNSNSNDSVEAGRDSDTNDLVFGVRTGSSNSNLTENNAWTSGQWRHVTVSVDESGTMRIYINGELMRVSVNERVPYRMVRDNNFIGRNHSTKWLTGQIDDFIVFDASLSPAEVEALYHSTDGRGLSMRSVVEDATNGTTIFKVTADDPEADVLSFLLLDNAGGRFTIDPVTGVVSVADGSLIDYEISSQHNIVVEVSDPSGNKATKALTIEVLNADEGAPANLQAGYYTSDILAAFSFDEGAGTETIDLSPNENHLSLEDGAGWTPGLPENGTAAVFTTGGYAQLGAVETGGPMTFAAWVRADSLTDLARVFDFGINSSSDKNFFVKINNSSGDLGFRVNEGGQSDLIVPNFWVAGQWIHLTVTVDAQGIMRAYKNGVLAGAQPNGRVPSVMVRSLNNIARSSYSTPRFFDGSVDDVVILRKALDPAGVAELYSVVKGGSLELRMVAENSSNGTHVVTARAENSDSDAMTFHLVEDAGGRFSIDQNTGAVTVANGALLDYESAINHEVTVEARDAAGNVTARSFLIHLIDVPDPATVSYSYDEMGRLISVNFSDGWTIQYEYDPSGNRTAYVINNAP